MRAGRGHKIQLLDCAVLTLFYVLSCEIIRELCAAASFIFPPNEIKYWKFSLTCSVTPSDSTEETHAPGLLEHSVGKLHFRLDISELSDFYSLDGWSFL